MVLSDLVSTKQNCSTSLDTVFPHLAGFLLGQGENHWSHTCSLFWLRPTLENHQILIVIISLKLKDIPTVGHGHGNFPNTPSSTVVHLFFFQRRLNPATYRAASAV